MQAGLTLLKLKLMLWDTQCTGKRIDNKKLLIGETMAYMNNRNENKCKINWNFTKKDADEKLSKHYV